MFNFVHHVRIFVHNSDDMVQYMEQNFGMAPAKVEVFESRGMKNATYKVSLGREVLAVQLARFPTAMSGAVRMLRQWLRGALALFRGMLEV